MCHGELLWMTWQGVGVEAGISGLIHQLQSIRNQIQREEDMFEALADFLKRQSVDYTFPSRIGTASDVRVARNLL